MQRGGVGALSLTKQAGSPLTLVVLTLLPVLQDQPVRSGRTLHSSPSIHGCMWHHHFWATMEAAVSNGDSGKKKDSWLLKQYDKEKRIKEKSLEQM